ncbi:MAG: F0F1 ATP synthase subunit delta [Propioniciclava sp.]|uniref:F0F1 ATP synthase subunit delta n=1 Tax=Propioniciclava sp. TaxID=2038686 RepID=UPI0039E2F515
MSAAAESRLQALDGVLDGQHATAALADELFSVVDALGAQPALRRALSDPSTPDEVRAQLAESLFGQRLGGTTVTVIAQAARARWGSSSSFIAAIERQGVRALLRAAQDEGKLDELEDQLFKVERLVDANPELRQALADRVTPVQGRKDLLSGLLQGRVLEATRQLARRAVEARQRTFALTVEGYLAMAAALRERAIATVTTAIPLTDEQEARLKTVLSRQVGRDVNLRVVLDPTVIGGVRVSLGDEVIEGTVAARLDDAQRKLA